LLELRTEQIGKDENVSLMPTQRVFGRWQAADSFNKVWVRACTRAGITDLRFHDLRHEACSRLADKFSLHELMKITGHKSAAMLARYYHPRAEELAKKLA
jgi:integrase